MTVPADQWLNLSINHVTVPADQWLNLSINHVTVPADQWLNLSINHVTVPADQCIDWLAAADHQGLAERTVLMSTQVQLSPTTSSKGAHTPRSEVNKKVNVF